MTHGNRYGNSLRKEIIMNNLQKWMTVQGWTPCQIVKNYRGDPNTEYAHWENDDEYANVTYDGKRYDVDHHLKRENQDLANYFDHRD